MGITVIKKDGGSGGGGSAGGFWNSVTTTTDFVISNNGTYTDVTGLSVSLEANSLYLIALELGGYRDGSGTGQWFLDYSGTKADGAIRALDDATGAGYSSSADILASKVQYITTSGTVFVSFRGYIETTTAGDLQVQLKQANVTMDDTVCVAGSTIMYKKVV
jgi:hypothetical protein